MLTASKLRKDIYRMLDEVLSTGESLEIKRKGQILKIVPDKDRGSRLARLHKHESLAVEPEELVHVDWSKEWSFCHEL